MITHDTPTTEVCSDEYNAGSANTTIEESANATATAAATPTVSSRLRRSRRSVMWPRLLRGGSGDRALRAGPIGRANQPVQGTVRQLGVPRHRQALSVAVGGQGADPC